MSIFFFNFCKNYAEPEAKKPEQPLPFNEQRSLEEIEKHALECRRPPGEPRVWILCFNFSLNPIRFSLRREMDTNDKSIASSKY